MSYLDARGHRVPSGTDLASRQSLLDLSLSIGDIKTVSSQSAAQTYVNGLKSAGVTASADNCIYVDVSGTLRRWNGTRWEDVKAHAADPLTTITVSSGAGWQVDAEYTTVRQWGHAWWASLNIKRTDGAITRGEGGWFPLLPLPSSVTPAPNKMFVGMISMAGYACPVFWASGALVALSTASITVSNGVWCSGHLAWIA